MFCVVIGLLSAMPVINAVQSSPQLNGTLFSWDFIEPLLYFITKRNVDDKVESFRLNKDAAKDTKDVENASTTAIPIPIPISLAIPSSTRNWQNWKSRGQSLIGRTPLPLCCPYARRLTNNQCIETNGTFRFPPLYDSNNFTLIDEKPDYQHHFDLFVRDPCVGRGRYKLNPDKFPDDSFMLLDNGSIYMQNEKDILQDTNYCFGIVDTDAFNVILCFDLDNQLELQDDVTKITVVFPVGLIVSVPFLFTTFIVYTLIPELKNMHGRTLRGYIGSLLSGYIILAIVQISPQEQISDPLCIVFAFIIHFSFLASFFWLNVMCFDIWWTFGGFRSLQGSVKQRECKKFVMYSIYAWGCASVVTGICIIMDFLPDIPEYFIKPEFGKQSCWFTTNKAKAIYFYGPMGVTVFCNICLFISTAIKIVQHQKNTAQHLKGIDSRRHDDNKQWFNLYLKLFIVMGINWAMEIISWLCNNSPAYIWYLTDVTNTLQGVIIFLIFVWKDKVRRLLLKRFGYHKSDALSRNSARSNYHSSAVSRTCVSATPFQEKITDSGESAYNKVTIDN